MISEIEKKIKEVKSFNPKDFKDVENFRIKYIGKKGFINHFFSEFKKVKSSDKKAYGLAINELKKLTIQKLEDLNSKFNSVNTSSIEKEDLTRPFSVLEL